MAWLLRFAFVLYCTMAGVILVLVPWSSEWHQVLYHLGLGRIGWLAGPWIRGAVSGFGLVHLVWGTHDLNALLAPPTPYEDPPQTSRDHR